MENVVLVIHLFLALAIIGLVLLQRSEGGALGIGGGGGGMGRLTTARGATNLLTRATAICAACFFATSLILAILAGHDSEARKGLLDSIAEAPAPAVEAPVTPEAPVQSGNQIVIPPTEAPSAPISQ